MTENTQELQAADAALARQFANSCYDDTVDPPTWLVRKAAMRRGTFFMKMARAYSEPFVTESLHAMLAQVLPALQAMGFAVETAPALKLKMGASFAIREASVLLKDPASTEPSSNLVVMARLVTRCDVNDKAEAADLMIDVVARRVGIPGDATSQRPFLLTILASVRVDWHNLGTPSFSNALYEGITYLQHNHEADGSFAAGGRTFAAELVEKLAP